LQSYSCQTIPRGHRETLNYRVVEFKNLYVLLHYLHSPTPALIGAKIAKTANSDSTPTGTRPESNLAPSFAGSTGTINAPSHELIKSMKYPRFKAVQLPLLGRNDYCASSSPYQRISRRQQRRSIMAGTEGRASGEEIGLFLKQTRRVKYVSHLLNIFIGQQLPNVLIHYRAKPLPQLTRHVVAAFLQVLHREVLRPEIRNRG
jgi:hypothetical protein